MRRPLALLLALAAVLAPAAALVARGAGEQTVYLPLLARPGVAGPIASYLGGPGDDAVSAADFDAAGRLLLAGRWAPGLIGGVTPADLPGGAGAVVLLGPAGEALAAARVGGTVRDMEASAAGAVAACGDMGVVLLSADLRAVRWRAAPGDVARCAADGAGNVAALVGRTIHRFGPDGAPAGAVAVEGSAVSDVALDGASGLVFAAGYTQKRADLKVAFLRAYGPDGALRWAAYDFAADAVVAAGLTADSEGRRVAVGADGKLYFAGWTDGGNAIYGRAPQDLARRLGPAELASFDGYNTPFNLSGAKSLAWYGRFEPDSGALLRGQWLLTRLGDGKGNSIGVGAIDAAADGTVAIAGGSAATIAGRAGMQLAGVELGAYELDEPYLLVVSPDFSARRLWTAFAAPGASAGGSPATAVAIRGGAVALGATLNPRATAPPRGLVTTAGAPQPANASPGAPEGYFALLRTP
jgi:hypothetical protein